MANDPFAQMLAASTRGALASSASRDTIAVGVLGQSNERGNVAGADAATYPTAFQSARNAGESVPFSPSVTRLGSYWPAVVDELSDWGYDLKIVNGAIGGLSFLTQLTPYINTRQSNFSGYSVQRQPGGTGDRGDFGSVITITGFGSAPTTRYFVCVAGGQQRFVTNRPPIVNALGNSYQDAAQWTVGAATAAVAPDFSAAAAPTGTALLGGQVVDGGITWARISESFYGVLNNGVMVSEHPTTFVSSGAQLGRGFDPLGVCDRLLEELMRVRATRRIAYIAYGQSDLGVGAAVYSAMLQSAAQFFLNRRCEVMLGLTNFSPLSSGATGTNYGFMATGRASAVAALQAKYPGKVWDGADLYAAMGSTGPMASGGAFLDADGIHLNGAGAVGPVVSGVSSAKVHVAAAIKAALPRRATL
jgi:hypothetical protein